MPNPVTETGCYENISSSTLIYTGACQLLGFKVNSATSGTVKIWDNTSAAAPIVINTTSVNAGEWHPVPATIVTGIYVTIGGTADITVFYNP